MAREMKFEYGFESVNGIIKKVYCLHEIPFIAQKCDVWNINAVVYVRQYTGLKDNNGKEIYEGDMLEVHGNKNGSFLVEFKNEYVGGWILTHGKDYQHISLGARKSFDVEILGNIHENKELLNK